MCRKNLRSGEASPPAQGLAAQSCDLFVALPWQTQRLRWCRGEMAHRAGRRSWWWARAFRGRHLVGLSRSTPTRLGGPISPPARSRLGSWTDAGRAYRVHLRRGDRTRLHHE